MEQLAREYADLYQSQLALRASQMAKIRGRNEVRQGIQPLGDLLREVLRPGQKISIIAMASLLKSLQPVVSIAEYMNAEMKLEMAKKRMKTEDPRMYSEDSDEVPRFSDRPIGDEPIRANIDERGIPGSLRLLREAGGEQFVGIEDIIGSPRAGSEAGSAARAPTDPGTEAFQTAGVTTMFTGLSDADRSMVEDFLELNGNLDIRKQFAASLPRAQKDKAAKFSELQQLLLKREDGSNRSTDAIKTYLGMLFKDNAIRDKWEKSFEKYNAAETLSKSPQSATIIRATKLQAYNEIIAKEREEERGQN